MLAQQHQVGAATADRVLLAFYAPEEGPSPPAAAPKEYYYGPRVGKREVITGPRGGRYYINDNGGKTPVQAHYQTVWE